MTFVRFFYEHPLEDIWKTTSIFLEMEDDLNFFEKGRQAQFFLNGRQPHKNECNQKQLKLETKYF
jgi:hypothetical protein